MIMRQKKEIFLQPLMFVLLFTIICGILYTALVTIIAQIMFPNKANGSIIEVGGVKYGSELLAQKYTDEAYMWGRIMNLDVTTFQDENGTPVMYATPSNLSPASDTYKKLVADRVKRLKEANEEQVDVKIPVDLVTCSGSGLDPHISLAAANYQVPRLAKANDKTEEEINEIIKQCTTGKFLGIFGEETVHVLKINLMLEGIL